MTTPVFFGNIAADVVACFVEPSTSGAWNDINAACNAPAKTPGSYLSSISFHSRFNYHVPAAGWPKTVTIPHDAYSADAGTVYGDASGLGYGTLTAYNAHGSKDYKIGDHSLGVIPPEWFVSVAINGINQEFPVGCPIQLGSNGGGRRSISFWCDATSLWVHEDVKPGVAGLGALSVTYTATVCRPTSDEAGAALFSGNISSSFFQMGRGRIKSTESVLRDNQAGDTFVFSLPTGPVGDLNNGKMRFVLLDMQTYDLGPIMGAHTYSGSFEGSPQKQVAFS